MYSFPRSFLLAVVAVTAVTISGRAADVTWTGGTSDAWDTGTNWAPEGVPGIADTAVIGTVATANQIIELAAPSYTLEGLSFLGGNFFLLSDGTPTITVTGGSLSSQSTLGDFNVIGVTVEMVGPENFIFVNGDMDHELQTSDLNVFGALTTDVSSSLCLGGVTTVTGAFVKSGAGHTCTEGGLTAVSTSVQAGEFMVESNSSLGTTTISAGATMSVVFSATATASSVATSGTLQIGANDGSYDLLVAAGGVVVADGGVLTGIGTVQTDVVTVQDGGVLAAGLDYATGLLAIEGDMDLQLNSIAVFSILAENQLQGWLSVDGDVTLDGFLSMNNTGAEGLYTLIEFTGTRFGAFSGTFDTLAGFNYQIIYNANSVQLDVTAVPEPATWALLGLGGALLACGKLRRRGLAWELPQE